MNILLFAALITLNFPSNAMVANKALERKKANEYVHKMFAAVNDSDIDALLTNYNRFKECSYTSVPGIPDFWCLSNLLLRAVQVSNDVFLDQFLGIFPCDITMTIYDVQGNEKTLADYAISSARKAKLQELIDAAQTPEAMNEHLKRYLNFMDEHYRCCERNQAFYNTLKSQIAPLLEKEAVLPTNALEYVKSAVFYRFSKLEAQLIIELGLIQKEEILCCNEDLESLFMIAVKHSVINIVKAFITAGVDVNQITAPSLSYVKERMLEEALSDNQQKFMSYCFVYAFMLHGNLEKETIQEQKVYFKRIMEALKAEPCSDAWRKARIESSVTSVWHKTTDVNKKRSLEENYYYLCGKWKKSDTYRQATPLMVAVCMRNSEVTQLLLAAGARIEAEDKNGNTALEGPYWASGGGWDAEEGFCALIDAYCDYLEELKYLVQDVLPVEGIGAYIIVPYVCVDNKSVHKIMMPIKTDMTEEKA